MTVISVCPNCKKPYDRHATGCFRKHQTGPAVEGDIAKICLMYSPRDAIEGEITAEFFNEPKAVPFWEKTDA